MFKEEVVPRRAGLLKSSPHSGGPSLLLNLDDGPTELNHWSIWRTAVVWPDLDNSRSPQCALADQPRRRMFGASKDRLTSFGAFFHCSAGRPEDMG